MQTDFFIPISFLIIGYIEVFLRTQKQIIMNKFYVVIFLLLSSNLFAQSIRLTEFSSGYNWLMALAHSGNENLYAIQKTGQIYLVDKEGNRSAQPFLDIASKVRSGTSDERGLLGVAFHPEYADNGHFYIYYNKSINGNISISRFTRSSDTTADPNSEVEIISFPHPRGNHVGGGLAFGPDGYLYAGVGDGGGQRDPDRAGQNLNTFQGKILRLDISNGTSYSIPADNPFVGMANVKEEIWAYGFRNPWRFDFDNWTGDLWITDVGQDDWEEVNLQLKGSAGGENYGWSCRDGSDIFNTSECVPGMDYIDPLFQYAHVAGNCSGSISGGVAYRGMEYGDLFGNFFVADFCTGNIYMTDKAGNSKDLGQFDGFEYTTLNENHLGEMFLTGFFTNRIFQIHSDNPAPTAFITNGSNVFICENAQVTLGAYNLPAATHISYTWMKDGALIPGANTPGLLVSEEGNYQVVVTNNNNGAQSTSEETVVTLGEAPVVEIMETVNIGDTFGGVVINGDTTFTRVFTSSIGCDSTVQYIISSLSGLYDLVDGKVEITLAPNPFKDNLVLNLNLQRATNLQFELYDMSGKRIKQIMENTRLSKGKQSHEIDLSNLPKGAYLIRGTSGQQIFTERLMKI